MHSEPMTVCSLTTSARDVARHRQGGIDLGGVSRTRLIITAVVVEGRSQADVARAYGVAESWVSRLVARFRAEGDSAFEPRSRRPATRPDATPLATVEVVLELRRQLTTAGLDAGADTIVWHLEHHHVRLSRATVYRILRPPPARHGRTGQAPQILVHPLRSRSTERDLAGRLHPSPPRRRQRHRDPVLDRRPLAPRPQRHRPPPGHRGPKGPRKTKNPNP